MNLMSLKCFLLCIPLIEEGHLRDFLYRVAGEPDPAYLMAKLVDLWEQIPESPSKSYVEKYIYYHLMSPSVDGLAELAPAKHEEYLRYRDSRVYGEEELAYRLRLWEFRAEDP